MTYANTTYNIWEPNGTTISISIFKLCSHLNKYCFTYMNKLLTDFNRQFNMILKLLFSAKDTSQNSFFLAVMMLPIAVFFFFGLHLSVSKRGR